MTRLLGSAIGVALGLGAAALLSGCPFGGACKDEILPVGTYAVTRTNSGDTFGSFLVGNGKLVHTVTIGADAYVVTYLAVDHP